jgi:hypothetical protein
MINQANSTKLRLMRMKASMHNLQGTLLASKLVGRPAVEFSVEAEPLLHHL